MTECLNIFLECLMLRLPFLKPTLIALHYGRSVSRWWLYLCGFLEAEFIGRLNIFNGENKRHYGS